MGFIEEDMGRQNIEAIGDIAGPRVHLYFFDPIHSIWDGAVVLACKVDIMQQQAPMLTFSVTGDEPGECVGEIIHAYAEWRVVRFRIRVPLEEKRAQLKYSIRFAGSSATPGGVVQLPAECEDWHVVAYSCNDQRQHPKVGVAAWTRMKMLQKKKPIHVMLGTGDQLYNDNVWHMPGVEAWVKIEDKAAMRATPLAEEQVAAVEEFYFFAYVRWLALHPLAEELSSIPMMNTWDDHDIFDGWGSYPEHLQECAAFQQIYKVAKKNFAAFQLATTSRMKRSDGYFTAPGDTGFSWMSQLGPRFAVAALDTRSSRTRERIVPQRLLETLTARIEALPASVDHLLFVSAVPIEYPEVGALETFMSAGEGTNIFTKTGMYNKLMNEFGEPELLDDLLDHWGSSRHVKEKGLMLNALRTAARDSHVRISILGGDVHLAGLCFVTGDEKYQSVATDPGFMPQLISSAVAYDPPPAAVVRVLDRYAASGMHKTFEHDPPLWGGSCNLFKERKPGTSIRFADRNNFIEFEVTDNALHKGVAMLKCTWHIRPGTDKSDEPNTEAHSVAVPPLLKPGAPKELASSLQEDLEPVLPGRGTFLRKTPCCGCCFAQCGL